MNKICYLGILSIFPFFTSCATILSGSKANVTVSTSTNEPARANVEGRQYYINGPTNIEVKRGYSKTTIYAENDDSFGSVDVKKTFNPVSLGNILLGGVPGLAVDGISGAITKPNHKEYTIYMQPKEKQSQESVKQPKDEPTEMVRNTGETALEQTIIRWDVQSRPQGADIFWRVVSKTPEVKSTNNKYLTTTPYEATKALDIKGLTYETSSNVRIILRCEKDGYLPQEKEYDVRMIIDQEEISSFFRLVKEDE